ELLQGRDGSPVARQDESRPLPQHRVRLWVDPLDAIRLDDGDDGRPGRGANLEVADAAVGAGCPRGDCVPLQEQVIENDVGGRGGLGQVGRSADDAGNLPGLTVGQGDDGGDLVRVLPREVVQFAPAVVVNHDGQPVAAGRLDLEFAADAGQVGLADGGHDKLLADQDGAACAAPQIRRPWWGVG